MTVPLYLMETAEYYRSLRNDTHRNLCIWITIVDVCVGRTGLARKSGFLHSVFDLVWFTADGPTVTHRQIHATHSPFLKHASTQRCINIQQLHIYSAIFYYHPHKNLKLWLMNILDSPNFSLVFTWVYRLDVMTISVQHLFYCIIIHIHYNKSIIVLLLCLLLELNLQFFFLFAFQP